MSFSTSDWHSLGNVQYHKRLIYDMSWSQDIQDLKNFRCAAAPYGGPIAVIRDSKKLVAVSSGNKLSPTIIIFSSSGIKLCDISCGPVPFIDMAWTSQLRLVCVYQDGSCLLYNMFGDLENTFSLLPQTTRDKIVQVNFFSAGLVAMTNRLLLIQTNDIDSLRPRISLMADTGLTDESPPTSMCIFEPRFTKSGQLEVFLGTHDCSVLVITKNSCIDLKLQSSLSQPITRMSIAPNGMFMALYTQDGFLTVLNTSFDKKILSFDTQSTTSPLEMLWCGEDSVILYWKQLGLLMVGPFGDWLKFSYDESLFLVQEVDCCRIYSSSSHELLQRVPTCTESIRKIGSTTPAAMLYDAKEAFDSGDANADENIRSIQASDNLEEAVLHCIEAAGAEFDPIQQKILLRAASYGKCFCDQMDADVFVDTCKMLRILNAIRSPYVSMPLTAVQYERLTPEVVISRLIAAKHHAIALKICEYLKITTDRVLVHWACEKVKKAKDLTDEEVLLLLQKKLKDSVEVSYSEIANCAEKSGRRRLATLLLDLEERASDQVPLLLSMEEYELALRKAIESSDSDLIYLCCLHIERCSASEEEFRKILLKDESYREAVDLMVSYYIQIGAPLKKLQALWLDPQGLGLIELANASTRRAYKTKSTQERIKQLQNSVVEYTQAKSTFHVKATEEQIELLQEQMKLEEKTGKTFVDLSVSETIKNLCYLSGEDPKLLQYATGIYRKFKISEKTFYRLKIQALADSLQWDALLRFSQEKKTPPSGFKPFALACAAHGERQYAEMYCNRITSLDEKFDTFVSMMMWTEALNVAVKMKDPNKLSLVRNQCNDSEIHLQVDQAAKQLGFIS